MKWWQRLDWLIPTYLCMCWHPGTTIAVWLEWDILKTLRCSFYKSSQNIWQLLGYFEKRHFKAKLLWLIFVQCWEKLGYFSTFWHLVTLNVVVHFKFSVSATFVSQRFLLVLSCCCRCCCWGWCCCCCWGWCCCCCCGWHFWWFSKKLRGKYFQKHFLSGDTTTISGCFLCT